ncbi:MAG: tetraacyldisaccharide 4'-kinase [Alphaproteobacteria bacterium]
MMRQPRFWQEKGHPASTMLGPVAFTWNAAGKLRRLITRQRKTPIPSICVGNVTVGGAGKTPVTIAIAEILRELGGLPAIATRGYGARIGHGVVHVDPLYHTAADVGDEPLLLVRAAPCYVSHDRYQAALAAKIGGASHVIFDDGMQNPRLAYDAVFLVIDGGYGIGNGLILPAGPLRESLADALKRCHAVVIIGEDLHGVAAHIPAGKPVFRAAVVPEFLPDLPPSGKFLAFAGIARPEKFFETCRNAGLHLAGTESFADHYPYTATDMETLDKQAVALNAGLLTTAKDAVRLPADWAGRVKTLAVKLQFDDPRTIRQFLPNIHHAWSFAS